MFEATEAKKGYLDLRILHLMEVQGGVDQECIDHIQELIDSKTLYSTFHWVQSLARDLSLMDLVESPEIDELDIDPATILIDSNGETIKINPNSDTLH